MNEDHIDGDIATVGMSGFAPYLMNRVIHRYNQTLLERMNELGLTVTLVPNAVGVEEDSGAGWLVSLFGVFGQAGEDRGLILGHVSSFAGVLLQVIQFPVGTALGLNGFPVFLPDCDLLSVFPVEHEVFLLRSAGQTLPDEGGGDGNAVYISGYTRPTDFREGGKDIRLVKDMITNLTGRDMPGPTNEKGNLQSTFV